MKSKMVLTLALRWPPQTVMSVVPAQEIKRRGIAAVDEALAQGPVHIIRNNRARYAVFLQPCGSGLRRH